MILLYTTIKNDNELLYYLYKNYDFCKFRDDINGYELVKLKLIKCNMITDKNATLDLIILSVRECIKQLKQDNYIPYVPYVLIGYTSNDVLNYIKLHSKFLSNQIEYREYLGAMRLLKDIDVLRESASDERFIIYCVRKFIESYMTINGMKLPPKTRELPVKKLTSMAYVSTNGLQSREQPISVLTRELTPLEKRVKKQIELEQEAMEDIARNRREQYMEQQSQSREQSVKRLPVKEQPVRELINKLPSKEQPVNKLLISELLDKDFICLKCNRKGRFKMRNGKYVIRHYHEYGKRKGYSETDHIVKNIELFLKVNDV